MKKILGLILLTLFANKLESMDKKEQKTSSQKIDQILKIDKEPIKNEVKEEGCFFCCSKTDCTKQNN